MKPTPAIKAARIPSGAACNPNISQSMTVDKATRYVAPFKNRWLRYTLPSRAPNRASANAVIAQVTSNMFSAVIPQTRGSAGKSGVAPWTHVRINATPNTKGEIPATARRTRVKDLSQTAVTQSPFSPFAPRCRPSNCKALGLIRLDAAVVNSNSPQCLALQRWKTTRMAARNQKVLPRILDENPSQLPPF